MGTGGRLRPDDVGPTAGDGAGGPGEVTWLAVPCASDHRTHLVTESDLAEHAALGRFPAACGWWVLGTSLGTAPGERCPRCREIAGPPRGRPDDGRRRSRFSRRSSGRASRHGSPDGSGTRPE